MILHDFFGRRVDFLDKIHQSPDSVSKSVGNRVILQSHLQEEVLGYADEFRHRQDRSA